MQSPAGKLRACARLTRMANSLMVGFAVIVGLAIAAGRGLASLPLETLFLAYTTGFTISASSMILNDIVDVETDRVNAPHRPIVSGEISPRTALACYASFTAIGLAASAVIGWKAFAVALVGWATGSLYDVWGKRSGFPGNLMVSLSTSLPLPYAMAVLDAWEARVTVFWAMIFLAVLGREIAKDIADVEGDSVIGARTLPIVLGARTSAIIAGAAYLAAVALSPLPLLEESVNPLAYGVLVAVVDAILVAESARIIARPTRKEALKHKRNILIAMFIGLAAFMLGSLLV